MALPERCHQLNVKLCEWRMTVKRAEGMCAVYRFGEIDKPIRGIVTKSEKGVTVTSQGATNEGTHN